MPPRDEYVAYVHLIELRGLIPMNFSNTLDPVVKLSYEGVEQYSNVHYNTQAPDSTRDISTPPNPDTNERPME